MSAPPKLFISYRWSSPDHVEWVLNLAQNLRGDGIDVKLDKWDLKPGHDALAFMEGMVSDPSVEKVLIISDSGYAKRANQREGGVGVEAQIISPKIYASTEQEKFAAVLLDLDDDGRPILPHFLSNRIYFDFTTKDGQATNYDQVLRWVFDQPLDLKPPIGPKPKHLNEPDSSTSEFRQKLIVRKNFNSSRKTDDALSAIEEFGQNASSLIIRLKDESDQLDAAYEAILATVDAREQIYSALRDMLRGDKHKAFSAAHRLIEDLLKWTEFTPHNQTSTIFDNDPVKFFLHETFVGFVALALQEGHFVELKDFLARPFYLAKHDDRSGESVHYVKLRPYLESLERRNQAKNLRRLSLHADVVNETHQHSLVSSAAQMEADLILHVRGMLDRKLHWYPISSLYLANTYGTTRLFVRSESTKFFSQFGQLFFGLDASTFRNNLLTAIKEGQGARFDYQGLDYDRLLGLERIATID